MKGKLSLILKKYLFGIKIKKNITQSGSFPHEPKRRRSALRRRRPKKKKAAFPRRSQLTNPSNNGGRLIEFHTMLFSRSRFRNTHGLRKNSEFSFLIAAMIEKFDLLLF